MKFLLLIGLLVFFVCLVVFFLPVEYDYTKSGDEPCFLAPTGCSNTCFGLTYEKQCRETDHDCLICSGLCFGHYSNWPCQNFVESFLLKF